MSTFLNFDDRFRFGLYSYFMTQLDVPNRQTTPTQHTRVLGSSFRCLDKERKRPQKDGTPGGRLASGITCPPPGVNRDSPARGTGDLRPLTLLIEAPERATKHPGVLRRGCLAVGYI